MSGQQSYSNVFLPKISKVRKYHEKLVTFGTLFFLQSWELDYLQSLILLHYVLQLLFKTDMYFHDKC